MSGTKSGFTTRLRLWSCSLAEQNRGYPTLSSPILKWLGYRKLNLTLLTLGPPTTSCLNIHPHHTTPPLCTDTPLIVATTRLIYIFWYGHRGWKKVKKVKKKPKISVQKRYKKKYPCGDFFLCPSPVSWCSSRCKQEQAIQPVTVRPVKGKWDNYSGCLYLGSQLLCSIIPVAACFLPK